MQFPSVECKNWVGCSSDDGCCFDYGDGEYDNDAYDDDDDFCVDDVHHDNDTGVVMMSSSMTMILLIIMMFTTMLLATIIMLMMSSSMTIPPLEALQLSGFQLVIAS